MLIACDEKIIFKQMLVIEKECTDINFERLKNALVYIKSNFIDSDEKIEF